MPAHDSVGLHDDQGRSPIPPRLGEQNPKQSIACAVLRTPDRAPENRQLLTQRHVLERDGSVSITEQPERSKQHDKRGQHALSGRPIDLRINRRGWRSSSGDPQFWIWSDQPGRDRTPFNVPDFIDYRDSARTLSGFAGYFAYGANLNDEAAAERVQGLRTSGNFFEVLRGHARMGRVLQPSDEHPGSDHVVVLTAPFWIRRFAAEPIVGRPIRLNGEAYTVVGVLADGFATPIRDVDFVMPFAPDRDSRRGARNS